MAVKIGPFQALSLTTVAAVYILIVLGGIVSSTGSGLACPDWPLCKGQIVPALTIDVLIEYTHRVSTIAVTLLVVSTMLFAWKKFGWPNKVTSFATLTFILLLGQIVLGMVTVESKTLPAVVTSHLALATLVFASALTATVTSFAHASKEGLGK